MVKKGSQLRNNKAIREMVANKQKIADNQYMITDALHNIICVDTEEGLVYRYVNDELLLCNTAETSKKRNGYLYVEIAINVDDKIININYAQHSLVAMCAYTSDYDELVETGVTPVVNHKDNCPWNNHSKNLEWTTQKWNVLHGRIVEAAAHAHSSEHSLAWLGYDLYRQQSNNKHNFDSLKVGISCKDIVEYERYVLANNKYAETLKDFWALNEKTDLLSLYNYDEFIKWWKDRNNIEL